MTARICRGADSHSVLDAGVNEALERYETGEPVMDRPPLEVLGAGIVAASGYADRDGGVAWLRG
jgi:hypothetical protein